jgi:mono/diheme cytochrome c family protein
MRRAATLLVLALSAACRQDMHDQPVYEPLEPGPFFADGRASRPPIPGTVARDEGDLERPAQTGREGSTFLARGPLPVDATLLARGRERYDVFCSPCHDRVGTGDGMIVQRGFRRPPSLHEPRLRDAADGYLFDVVTNGFGVMPRYASQVPAPDRWAIVAYVRALQLAQNAPLDRLTADERARLEVEAATP